MQLDPQALEREQEAMQPLWEELVQVEQELRPLRADRIPTGRVWLYLRKPEPTGSR